MSSTSHVSREMEIEYIQDPLKCCSIKLENVKRIFLISLIATVILLYVYFCLSHYNMLSNSWVDVSVRLVIGCSMATVLGSIILLATKRDIIPSCWYRGLNKCITCITFPCKEQSRSATSHQND